MSLLRRSDDTEAAALALAQRVHGIERVCGSCGAVGTCDVGEVLVRSDLAGNDVEWSRCRACVKLGRDWRRLVAASLLDLPADALVLDAVTVTAFADRPGASPSQPNSRPWGHVNRASLAEQVDKARVALDRLSGGPCSICGTSLTPRGTTWATRDVQGEQGRQRLAVCGRCAGWARDRQLTTVGWRSLVASVLLGHSTPTAITMQPALGRDVGLPLWSESGAKATVEAFAWLDTEPILRRAIAFGYATTIDPARWRLIDAWRGR